MTMSAHGGISYSIVAWMWCLNIVCVWFWCCYWAQHIKSIVIVVVAVNTRRKLTIFFGEREVGENKEKTSMLILLANTITFFFRAASKR